MKKITCFLTSLLLLTLANCQSDDSNNESDEAIQYLKNEWIATEQGFSTGDLSMLAEVDEQYVNFRPIEAERYLKIGMNKNNMFYFIHAIKAEGSEIGKPLDIKFGGVQYSDPLFKGELYRQEDLGAQEQHSFIVKIIDSQTIIVVFAVKFLHDISEQSYHKFSYYKFKKIGAWDESTNIRSIFKGLGYSEEWLNVMIGDHYEKDRSGGTCYSKE